MPSLPQVGIEDVQRFWDRQPCNIRHSNQPIGGRKYCQEVAKRRYFVEPHIPLFAAFAAWKGKKILEVGCGIGTDGAQFAQAGAEYTGAELSSESLKVAELSFGSLKLDGHFYCVDAEYLSGVVPLERYDLVYSFGVIHHSPRPERIIAEIKKYMAPGSELRIMLYAKYSWKSFLIWLGLDQPEAQYGCPIANTYSAREVRELLKGFEVVSITKAHIFPFRIPEYKTGEYRKTLLWRLMPEYVARLMRRYLGWHLLITARL